MISLSGLSLASSIDRAVKALERIAEALEESNEFARERWRLGEWKEANPDWNGKRGQ